MKKLLLAILMIFPLFVSACSCDKFDLSTYESAVKNFNKSTGFEYKLKITTKTQGASSYKREESYNKYLLTTEGNVYDFASEIKDFKIPVDSNGIEGNPRPERTVNRYYVGVTRTFYTKIKEGVSAPSTSVAHDTTYDDIYSEDSNRHNINNLVPTFTKDEITDFHITKLEGSKGYSIAMFKAPAPSYIEYNGEKIEYTVVMDKSFCLDTIVFAVVNGTTTTEYEYTFYNFNNDVNIEFPADLASYS